MDAARRNYIICRALYLALCRLERLPEDRRPQIDWDDMLEIINEPKYQNLIDAITDFEETQPSAPVLRLIHPKPKHPPKES